MVTNFEIAQHEVNKELLRTNKELIIILTKLFNQLKLTNELLESEKEIKD